MLHVFPMGAGRTADSVWLQEVGIFEVSVMVMVVQLEQIMSVKVKIGHPSHLENKDPIR